MRKRGVKVAKFAKKSTQEHVRDLLGEIRRLGGGTLNRQIVVNMWVEKAKQFELPLKVRQAVVAAVNRANV